MATRQPRGPSGQTGAAAVLASVLATCTLAAGLPAQEEFRPQEFEASKGQSLFSLPRSQEDIHQWQQGLADLDQGRLKAAVEGLHRLLQSESGGVVAVGMDRFAGLRLAVIRTLANLSPAAREVYENLVRREAGPLLQRPLHEMPRDQLELLAERFPASRVGVRARLRLGELALEAGEGTVAAGHLRQALDAVPAGTALARAIRERILAARIVDEPELFRQRVPADVDPDLAEEVLAALPPTVDRTGWPAFGGGGGGDHPMDEPAGEPQPEWVYQVSAPGFEYEGGSYAMHAVGDLDGIFVNNGLKVFAFDPLSQQELWESRSPMEEHGDLYRDMHEYGGAINQDLVLACAYHQDVVVAYLQVPELSDNVEFRGAIRIISRIPERRLFAFDRTSGKQIWSHWDSIDGPVTRRFRGQSACGPPLIVGDTVYVATHDRSGAIAFYLSAYDLHTGAPRWRRLICSSQQEVNMFGNARQEYAASPLALRDGVLYGATNLGVCFAADAASGRVRWIRSYDVTEMPRTRLHGQPTRIVYFRNNAPVVVDGVVALTPLDSEYALGIDTETGRLLWRLPHQAKAGGNNDVRWLLGAIGDEFLFAGAGVVAVKARPSDPGTSAEVRQVQRPEYLHSGAGSPEVPRPGLTDRYVYYASEGRLSIFDNQGTMAPRQGNVLSRGGGNLLLVDGIVVSLRNRMLEFAYDLQSLRRRAESLLRKDPHNAAAIYRLASLRRAQLGATLPDRGADALEDLYDRGLRAAAAQGLGPGTPLYDRLARDRFRLALDRAALAAAAGRRDAADRFRHARDLAPDADSWLEAQVQVLQLVAADPAATLAELAEMERRHSNTVIDYPGIGRVPVRAFVFWRRSQVTKDPEQAIEDLQALLERYPELRLGAGRAADLARQGIDDLIERHGIEIYRPIQERARQELAAAGDDPDLLQALARRFPHSDAAEVAVTRLLDLSVVRGDLGAAVEVFARDLTGRGLTPGLLRRLLVAAEKRGNGPLALALADRLRAVAGDASSDWPADQGQTFAEVAAAARQRLLAAADSAETVPQLPSRIVHSIDAPPLTRMKLLELHVIPGFAAAPEVPIYAQVDGVFLEAHSALPDPGRPSPLFRIKVEYCERLFLCGRTLLIPDLSKVLAVDYRTGQKLWEREVPEDRMLESLGVQSGVVHLFSQQRMSKDGGELLGIEPLSGGMLFQRRLNPRRISTYPKGTGGQIVMVEAVPGSPTPLLHRIDPLTGQTTDEIPLTIEVMRRLGIQPDRQPTSHMFAQGIFADPDTLYVPVDGRAEDDPPRLAAIDNRGTVRWTWAGKRGRRFLMHALRDDRIVVVEAGPEGGGRMLVLRRGDGRVLSERDLGNGVQVLNWNRTWVPQPAPEAVLISDRAPGLRLTCLSLTEGIPSFQVVLAGSDAMAIERPVLGPDFVAIGVQVGGRRGLDNTQTRLYVLSLKDRRGALPGGDKYLGLPLARPYGVSTHGAYTVISSDRGLRVLGDGRPK